MVPRECPKKELPPPRYHLEINQDMESLQTTANPLREVRRVCVVLSEHRRARTIQAQKNFTHFDINYSDGPGPSGGWRQGPRTSTMSHLCI